MGEPDYIEGWLWKNKGWTYPQVCVYMPEPDEEGYYEHDNSNGLCPDVAYKLTGRRFSKRSKLDPVRVRIPRWTILDEPCEESDGPASAPAGS